MYLRKNNGYWLEVWNTSGKIGAMWHKDYTSIMHLAKHNIQLGNNIKITNCKTETVEIQEKGIKNDKRG